MEKQSFKKYAIVSCGTMAPELSYLRKIGFLDTDKMFYTKPGRHEVPAELKSQLIEKIKFAARYTENIIVVYGGEYCYINVKDPFESIDHIIRRQGKNIKRIEASYCADMLVGEKERKEIAENIAEGEKVYWLTPGWILYSDEIFQEWDRAKANETFPKYTGGAILLDGIGFWENYVSEHPEKVLEFSDWMGIRIQPYKITLERFKNLLLETMDKNKH